VAGVSTRNSSEPALAAASASTICLRLDEREQFRVHLIFERRAHAVRRGLTVLRQSLNIFRNYDDNSGRADWPYSTAARIDRSVS
jgi:hypothetical protein